MALLEQKTRQVKWQERLMKLQAVEAWYQTYPLIPPYRPRLIDPSPFWHTVYRQKHAFDVASAHPEEVHVFAFEAENPTAGSAASKGQRKYLVTTYLQLWHTIHNLASRDKHASFYEVIPEGAACKLYFDLEFSRTLNPESCGNQMVEAFVKFVCEELATIHQVTCGSRHVINLDATTQEKFSRHLIYNLPQAVFKDNIQAGDFVQGLCQKITKMCQRTGMKREESNGEPAAKKTRHAEDEGIAGHPNSKEKEGRHSLQKLFVKNRDGVSVLFVDQGVYTRNRNFRLYKCSKLSKANPLLLAEENVYKPTMAKKMSPGKPATQAASERQLFLDSIITNVSYSPGTQILTSESQSRRKTSQDEKADNPNSQVAASRQETKEGLGQSPFPEIDAFIQSVVSMDGRQGAVRRWVFFSQGQLLVYDIVKNRWCGNIQRQHKSNNIMMLVDLRHGVYYQKCHDPDCRTAGYKSADTPLPSHLLPTFGEDLVDDEELLEAVKAAEEQEARGKTTSENLEDTASDDELLAASLEVERSMRAGNKDRGSEISCPGGLPSPVDSGREGVGDMTESDEELLAAVVDAESSSDMPDAPCSVSS